MTDRVRLSALLPERIDGLSDRARAALCQDKAVGGMKLAWSYVGSQLRQALEGVLDGDAMELLGSAWATAGLLAEYADPERHPPGERSVVEIGGHEVSRELSPVIAVTIAGCPPFELRFGFTVTGHFSGLKLAIADGHIVGGEAGEAWASGQLSLEGTPLHETAESKKLTLPGRFDFAPPGIRIPHLPIRRNS